MSTIRNINKNMDNLDKLSDDELRRRLLQYGFPNVPVTSNTRKILIKKLRNHMENEKSKLRRETTNVARYSSGEESDNDLKKNRYRTTISTATPSRGMMPPPISPGLSIKSRNSTSYVSPKPNIYVSDTIHSETDEDDDDYMNNSASTRISPSLGTSSSQHRYTTSNLSNGNNSSSSSENLPYLNDFTTRLLKLRGETVKSELKNNNIQAAISTSYSNNNNHHNNSSPLPYLRNNRLLYNTNNDIVHQVTPKYQQKLSRNIVNPLTTTTTSYRWSFRNILKKLDNNYGIKQPLVPCLLVSGLFVFLTVVIFIYLIISPDIVNNLNDKTTNYQLCNNIDTNDNCIQTENQLKSSLDLLKIIVPELEKRSISKLCDTNPIVNDFLTKNDIIKLLIDKNSHLNISTILSDLKNIEHLIVMNPQWHLNYNIKSNYFNIIKPKLPLICILKIKLHKFFIIIGSITILFITIYLIQFIIRIFITMRQSRKDKLNNLMNDIIMNVSELTMAAKIEESSKIIVINHLRDKLIPFEKRNELENVWNEAIRLLEQNESRLQFDIHMINGEECKVIKWIDTIMPISSNNNNNNNNNNSNNNNRSMIKKWQSPAFDKTNKIKDPPTPCLKIRQMFDKYEANDKNLKIIIQDSILEKVGNNNCQIYDIQLDTNTCCVYVRCATPNDAGIVHDEINGWWFDNRLVSIKFVRIERYLNRFPKSLSGPVCLRPSNTKKLSITNCDLQNASTIDDDDDLDDDDDNNLMN